MSIIRSKGFANTIWVAAIMGGLLFFGLTNPSKVPSVVLVVGFVVLFGLIFISLNLLLRLSAAYRGASRRRQAALLWGGSLLPVLLLLLQSIGQLTLRDVVTFVGLFVLGGLYLARLAK